MTALSWADCAERSLFTLHLDPDCFPHVLEAAPTVPSEVMVRMNCARCSGSVWVAYWPALRQGATIADLVQATEGLVSSG